MNLPRVAHPEGYRGLYVVDFGATCSVGYTAEEVALLLESEAYADAKVYRICRARPDGTMELKGVPRERFMLETGLFFYSRDLASGRRDYDQLRALAGAEPMPCRARLYMGMPVTSMPSKITAPSSGRIMPMVMRKVVVLPAPLRPRRPTISPCPRKKLTRSTTARPP